MASSINFNSTVAGVTVPAGVMQMFGGTVAPSGYLICDGTAVSRLTYASLFAAIGTTHGSGDGSTTFNLPDMRGMFPRGAVASALSSIAGSGTVTTNNATFTNHGINRTGMKVRLLSGTLSGLSTSTTYYAIVVDANTLAFATSLTNAIAGTKISITGTNSGVVSQWEDPDAATRFAGTVGAATNNVGSSQTDGLASHNHQAAASQGAQSAILGSGSTGIAAWNNGRAGYADSLSGGDKVIQATGGTETRPQNLALNFIIKV